jgi:hypothetical protein
MKLPENIISSNLWRKPWLIVASGVIALALSIGGVVYMSQNSNADPDCGFNHTNWENLAWGMHVSQVQTLADRDGWWIDTEDPDNYARGFPVCWDDSLFGKVFFYKDTDDTQKWIVRER